MLKVLIILGFLIVMIYLVKNLDIYNKESITDFFSNADKNRNFTLFFILLTTLFITFFVPVTWFSVLGSFFFGLKGFIYVFLACIIGSIGVFYISKIFRDDVMKIVHKVYDRKPRKVNLDEISKKINKFGIGYIFFLRSMPFIPYSVVNCISGVTSVKFKDYILGTIFGMGPGLFTTSYFLVKAVNIKYNPMGAVWGVGIKLIYVFAVIMWYKKSKYRTKE
jgi:uncharacterized membrane protein YdjX (TVP38/TMEM64 family)